MSASANDAKESATGSVNLTSNTLELVYNGGNQTVGLRWTGLSIPTGATITNAYIQFYSSSAQSGAASLSVQGQAADNPGAFTTASGNISSRPRTVAATSWSPPAWASNESNTNERTPDLSAVIQEIVSRPGWASGNALAIVVTGTGVRTAYSYDGRKPRAALLHVEYVPPDFPPVASLTVTQVATPPLTVNASGAGSTDTDATPIASYTFDFGDGSPLVTTTAPTTAAQHTYAAAGTYTVTLTATDTGGLTSAPVAKSITVQPDSPPVASLTVTQLSSPNFTVSASGAGSTDTDLTPIATYTFDFGDGSPLVTTTAPTAATQHTYAGTGTYTVTLTVTDTGSLTSAPVTRSITVNPPPDNPPVASLAVTQVVTPPLTVNADGSGSTDTDLTPIASYQFDFGDGSPVVTTTAPTATAQHTYAATGTYTVTLTVTDTGNLTSGPVTRSITVGQTVASATFERRVSASADDAEEFSNATIYLNSSDLELVYDGNNQTVGIRWLNLTIPPGSTITAAYIQFSAKESQSEVTNLTFQGQAADNPTAFTSTSGNVSTRPRTTARTIWSPPAWTSGQSGANQRTSDMTSVIQEIVSRPGWASGNALVVIVTGTGHRTAWAWDGNAAACPLLHVEFVPPESAPVAKLTLSQLAAPPLTAKADASGSTDVDATPIASYDFDFGDGSAVVHTTPPTVIAQHTYATAGTYAVTLRATDTGGLTSAPATASIDIREGGGPSIAVYAGYYDTHHPVNPQPKPDPWRNSPNTVFVGQPDNLRGDPPGGGWDTSCLRIDNLTASPISVGVTVDVGSSHYALWGTNTIPAGYHLVLAQTAYGNFDVPDKYPAGCYGCDPTLCLTMRSSEIPMVHVTMGGTTTDYADTAQTINTDGYDAAGCPYVGGPLPQTRYDESRNWVEIYSATTGALRASAAAGEAPPRLRAAPPRTLSLARLGPNPAHGGMGVRFSTPSRGPVRVGVYDLTGRLVRSCVDDILEAGDYNLQVSLSELPAGMYFVQLWTPQASRHEKLVLMR